MRIPCSPVELFVWQSGRPRRYNRLTGSPPRPRPLNKKSSMDRDFYFYSLCRRTDHEAVLTDSNNLSTLKWMKLTNVFLLCWQNAIKPVFSVTLYSNRKISVVTEMFWRSGGSLAVTGTIYSPRNSACFEFQHVMFVLNMIFSRMLDTRARFF